MNTEPVSGIANLHQAPKVSSGVRFHEKTLPGLRSRARFIGIVALAGALFGMAMSWATEKDIYNRIQAAQTFYHYCKPVRGEAGCKLEALERFNVRLQ